MAKFIAIHPVEPPASMDAIGPLARKTKLASSADAYWVKSWVQFNDDGDVIAVYCEWDGKDAETIKSALTCAIPELPFREVSRMTEIHSEFFR